MNHFKIVIEKSRLNAEPVYFLDDLKLKISDMCKNDTIFLHENGYIVLFLGLCYNKKKLMDKENSAEWISFASKRLIADPGEFLAQLEGSFCGFVFREYDRTLTLFSDHLSSQPIYYYADSEYFFVDTNIIHLVKTMRYYNKPVKVSDFGAYCMLAYSFMLDDVTPISGVYKLKPSSLFSMDKRQSVEYSPFFREAKIHNCPIEDIADGIHKRFSEAIENTFTTDGTRRHLISLSGGLDSRMCLLYAIRQGYSNISTLCYSQSFYREETIAKEISRDYNCEHIFFSLDNGDYLSNIDTGIISTQGMTTYRPILSARMVWEKLQMDRFGLVHTGLLGDAVLGGYCIDKCGKSGRFTSPTDFSFQLNPKNKSLLNPKYKNMLLPFLEDILNWIPSDKLLSLNSEKYVIENRYFNGLIQSYLGLRDISMISSPFVSRELLQYTFSFPSNIRLNHALYFTWMKRHMPSAMKYQWENTGLSPVYGRIQVKPNDWIVKYIKAVDDFVGKRKPERSRNPYQYWMKNNGQIMEDIINYCAHRIHLIDGLPQIHQFIKAILSQENIYLSTRAATLLGFLYKCYE